MGEAEDRAAAAFTSEFGAVEMGRPGPDGPRRSWDWEEEEEEETHSGGRPRRRAADGRCAWRSWRKPGEGRR